MAKVRASLKDVSTQYQPIEPATYEVEVVECTETVKEDDRVYYTIKAEIKGVFEDGVSTASDYDKRKITDFIHIHTRDGEINEVGLIQLKRWAEATVGEDRANDDDFDTDEMIGQRCMADIIVTTINQGPRKGEPTNEIRLVHPLP